MCATLRTDKHAAGRVGEGHKSPLRNGPASSEGGGGGAAGVGAAALEQNSIVFSKRT